VGSDMGQDELLPVMQAVSMTKNKRIEVERMRDVMVGFP
jgi:hypothetical protein